MKEKELEVKVIVSKDFKKSLRVSRGGIFSLGPGLSSCSSRYSENSDCWYNFHSLRVCYDANKS